MLLIVATLTALSSVAQKKVGFFGKKNFISIGVNPTVDFKMGNLLSSPFYLDGDKVKRQGVFTFRPGGFNFSASRALSNRFLIGASYRRSNFTLYSPQEYNSGEFFSPIKINRNQVSLYLEFSSYEWNSLIMGNFMNRLELGFEQADIPLTGEFYAVDEFFLGDDQQLQENAVVNTFSLENIFAKPEGYNNTGVFFRYTAMQSVPLSESFILRYGFDATFHFNYMEAFRYNYDISDYTLPENNYAVAMSTFKLMAFRSVVNFRTELIFAF